MANKKYELNEKGEKSCTKCGIFKHLDNFRFRKNYNNGGFYPSKNSSCISCENKQCVNWALNNVEYNIKRGKKHRIENRLKVLNHYGDKCRCCGETNFEFLALDHIEGGGNKHRKEINYRGQEFFRWIIRNNFPEGYRVLCHNCNFALGVYGDCPHRDGYDLKNYMERTNR